MVSGGRFFGPAGGNGKGLSSSINDYSKSRRSVFLCSLQLKRRGWRQRRRLRERKILDYYKRQLQKVSNVISERKKPSPVLFGGLNYVVFSSSRRFATKLGERP